MNFSQRIGITKPEKEIQLESMDSDLKNGLWNTYKINILDAIDDAYNSEYDIELDKLFSQYLWLDFFKLPIDEIPGDYDRIVSKIRVFFLGSKWYRIYDLIEFSIDIFDKGKIFNHISLAKINVNFNRILEREFAGYRFIENKISPIINKQEIHEIEDSLQLTSSFTTLKSCNIHLHSSLNKISDRNNPDYRNSIKESISAVESIAKILSGNDKDSLGGALDKIKGKLKIHPALERGYKQLYGYTSDGDGIRHALTDANSCDFEDAKYMLVSCSAFINYLISKANKAGFQFN